MNKLLGQVGAFRHIVMDTHKRLCAVRGDLVPVQAGHLRPLPFVRWKCLLRLQAQVGYFTFAHGSGRYVGDAQRRSPADKGVRHRGMVAHVPYQVVNAVAHQVVAEFVKRIRSSQSPRLVRPCRISPVGTSESSAIEPPK